MSHIAARESGNFEYMNEKGIVLDIIWSVEFETEHNYGADIDGNRGVSRTFACDPSWSAFNRFGEDVTAQLGDIEKEQIESRVQDKVEGYL